MTVAMVLYNTKNHLHFVNDVQKPKVIPRHLRGQ